MIIKLGNIFSNSFYITAINNYNQYENNIIISVTGRCISTEKIILLIQIGTEIFKLFVNYFKTLSDQIVDELITVVYTFIEYDFCINFFYKNIDTGLHSLFGGGRNEFRLSSEGR